MHLKRKRNYKDFVGVVSVLVDAKDSFRIRKEVVKKIVKISIDVVKVVFMKLLVVIFESIYLVLVEMVNVGVFHNLRTNDDIVKLVI